MRKVELTMDERKKYVVIKSLVDHNGTNKQRAALILGCTVRHINRMIIEKINLILAVLCERTIDAGHCLRHSNKYYKL